MATACLPACFVLSWRARTVSNHIALYGQLLRGVRYDAGIRVLGLGSLTSGSTGIPPTVCYCRLQESSPPTNESIKISLGEGKYMYGPRKLLHKLRIAASLECTSNHYEIGTCGDLLASHLRLSDATSDH